MSALSCTRLATWTIAAVLLQTLGISLFVLGFFPVKPALSGVSGPESYRSPARDSAEDQNERSLPPYKLRALYQELSQLPPSFERVILMVIDGLPAEVVLGKDDQPPSKIWMEAMPYTQSLLVNGMAIGYHAKAAPPTVTMPRLKAMVSGAIGGFLDVAFNFNTQALLDDNLLGQFLNIGWRMVMLGDETWLKLFPGIFTRHDGVSSFYVKDTVEVDHNVSRHLKDELERKDWNLLILHYLGLDHVGHIGGRNSILMAPKLKEMDDVIKMIHLSSVLLQGDDRGETLLCIVSDHGMTHSGNHGGSSYEETDSLALFVGLNVNISDYASATRNTAYQVDIAPTLALLSGVPIPKNSVGVLIAKTVDSLTDDQQLRVLELNSWQLLRLLQAELPDLAFRSLQYTFSDDQEFNITNCNKDKTEELFYCLYSNAASLHSSWKSKSLKRSNSEDCFDQTMAAYYEFLRTASEWLSHSATDKPLDLLATGVLALFLSCLILLGLLCFLCKEVNADIASIHRWHLEETLTFGVILILSLSMGSSSMVEEEQYIWHFVTSTMYVALVRRTVQSLPTRGNQVSPSGVKGRKSRLYYQICSVTALLISGRLLRNWHQGGVNWTHLPDISKWLEHEGSCLVKWFQLSSVIVITILSMIVLMSLRLVKYFVLMINLISLLLGGLVLQHTVKNQESSLTASTYGSTSIAQIIYATLGISTIGTAIVVPWIIPISIDFQDKYLFVPLRDSAHVIGWRYIFSWSLLQQILQQPVNSMPILLLVLQILACMSYFSTTSPHYKKWVEVAVLYYMGMMGHFSLGNSNTLATIDVAGAFIGISSYSTLVSGILMFIITYASPFLFLLSMMIYISMKCKGDFVVLGNAEPGHLLKIMLGFPCLVPLCLNSILLTTYTFVLVLMRNHLFVWSVFSPKYLYVCAATVCVYIGVSVVATTLIYICMVLNLRGRMLSSNRNATSK